MTHSSAGSLAHLNRVHPVPVGVQDKPKSFCDCAISLVQSRAFARLFTSCFYGSLVSSVAIQLVFSPPCPHPNT